MEKESKRECKWCRENGRRRPQTRGARKAQEAAAGVCRRAEKAMAMATEDKARGKGSVKRNPKKSNKIEILEKRAILAGIQILLLVL